MTVHVTLDEWNSLSPDHDLLRGRALSSSDRDIAESLAASERLIVTEQLDGLAIQTTSWVGRVALGDLEITVQPKIAPETLLALVRYAYGLRDFTFVHQSRYATSGRLFVDLLVAQLIEEVEELVARGLYRDYEQRIERLAAPRGRLNFRDLARAPGVVATGLPCIHHPRLSDSLVNRALLAGLQHSATLARDPLVRVAALRLATRLAEDVTVLPLARVDVVAAQRNLSRLTQAYGPALTLIKLLLDGTALSLSAGEEHLTARGFLFDMNKFFQSLLSRFLRDFLPRPYTLADEHRLTEVMQYATGRNPRGRRGPTPRPDFALLHDGKPMQFVDAKYRDLWEKNLPADMLYQLAIYALIGGASKTSVILYPALTGITSDQQVDIKRGISPNHEASVILRGVDLTRMRLAIERQSTAECRALAEDLVLSGSSTGD